MNKYTTRENNIHQQLFSLVFVFLFSKIEKFDKRFVCVTATHNSANLIAYAKNSSMRDQAWCTLISY